MCVLNCPFGGVIERRKDQIQKSPFHGHDGWKSSNSAPPRIETLIMVESSLKQHLETNPKICLLSGVYLDDPGKDSLSDYNMI